MPIPRAHPGRPQRNATSASAPVAAHAPLTAILAEVSREALLGEGLEAVLQGIVDCVARNLPVALASIILLDDDGTAFVQEVWAGGLELDVPGGLPWPVTVGAAGRCARLGIAQLIDDVEHDADYVAGNREVRSEYIVPIRHRARLHGVLNLESTHAGFFTAPVRELFDAVAAQVAGAIHLARLARELESANRKLAQLSMSDGLTGIANRRCFDERLAADWERAARAGTRLALLLVDADAFKALNDLRGHLYGDECLRELARLCAAQAGDDDLAARNGGEELALLLPDCDRPAARRRADALLRAVRARRLPHPASPVAAHLTVSIGVAALLPRAAQSRDSLVALADRALYLAKLRGRDRVASA
jgi:diguanylate cyclase (GGDEF)-like protein